MRNHLMHTLVAICFGLSSMGCGSSGQPPKEDDASKSGADAKPPPVATRDTPAGDEESADDEASEDDLLLAALDPRVLRATELAETIERDPESSDEVLARADLDREGLDALMYEIAINPELASQYRIARGLR